MIFATSFDALGIPSVNGFSEGREWFAGDSVGWGSTASVTRCANGGVCVGARGFF